MPNFNQKDVTSITSHSTKKNETSQSPHVKQLDSGLELPANPVYRLYKKKKSEQRTKSNWSRSLFTNASSVQESLKDSNNDNDTCFSVLKRLQG